MNPIPILLSQSGYPSKDSAIEALGADTCTMHNNLHHLTPPELAVALTQGYSYCPGIHHSHRTRENFVQKQLFSIDIDSGWTIDEFIQEAEVLNLLPNFIYTTFRHSPDHPKFRAVYILPESVKNVDQAETIQKVLIHSFLIVKSGVDKKTYDPIRLFFGGKEIVYQNFNQVTTLVQIVDAFNLSFRLRCASEKNFIRLRDLYLKKSDTDLSNVFIDMTQDNSNNCKFGRTWLYKISPCASGITESDSKKVSQNIVQSDQIPVNKVMNKKNILSQFRNGESTPRPLTNQMKGQFMDRCPLIQSLSTGDTRIPHASLFHIASSLYQYKGGEKWFKAMLTGLINNGNEDSRKIKSFDSRHNSTLRNPFPTKCECGVCPFFNQCQRKGVMIHHQLDMHRNSQPIKREVPRRMPNEIFEEMNEDVQRDMTADDNKVYVYKAPCGVGKSEAFLRMHLDGTFIAAPTHKLSVELYNRYLAKHGPGYEPFLWKGRPTIPALCEDDLTEKYLHQLENMEFSTKPVLDSLLERNEVSEDTKGAIRHYLSSLIQIHEKSLIFGTHKKALTGAYPKVKTIIFDEDIRNSILETKLILQADLTLLRNNIRNMEGVDNIKKFLREVECSESGVPMKIERDIPEEEMKAFSNQNMKLFTSPIMFLFRAQAFQRVNAGILCSRKQNLRDDKKYLVFSATASKMMYQLLFGDRLVWRDYGQAQLAGRIHLHLNDSFTKTYIKRVGEEDTIKRIVEDQKKYGFEAIITYKDLCHVVDGERYLKRTRLPVAATFGALEGLNTLTGTSFAIYGTPNHPQDAMALTLFLLTGEYPDSFREKYSSAVIDDGEWVYPAFVSPDETLRQYHVEAVTGELIQAIGRARLTREDRDIHVFSNLPCAGGDPWD